MNNGKLTNKLFWSGMIGNILDHYDMALYTFLVPFISPIFFPGSDPIMQLIMGYGITAISFISRPLGAMIFGNVAMRLGARYVLIVTLIGVSLSTCAIGFIPGYDDVGIWGGVILVLVRFIQGIFAAGELSVAGIFVLDHSKVDTRAKVSSYYMASCMIGSMMASAASAIVSWTGHGDIYWRYAFISGAITGLIGLIIRFRIIDNYVPKLRPQAKAHKIVVKHRISILRIIFVSSFSYITFAIPFVFLNKFVPLFADVSLTQMMTYNSIMMVIDIALLPIAGHLSQKYDVSKWMASMVTILAVTAIPAFYLLNKLPFYGIMCVKLWLVVVGLAYAAPLRAWLFSLINTSERYMITGLGYSIGTEVLGRQTTVICWFLWYQTGSVVAPAYYIVAIGVCTLWALLYKVKV